MSTASQQSPPFFATLRGHLTVQVAVQAIAFALLVDWQLGASPAWVRVLVFLACFPLVGLISVLALFLVAWVWRMRRSPAQSIGPVATFRLLLAEWRAYVQLYLGYHLLEPWLGTRNPAQTAPGQHPVLFIHGFMCNGGYFTPLIRFLQGKGFNNLYTINCWPPFGSIDRFAEQVAARVDHILAETGAAQITLVGHSMGGLIARAYVQQHGGAEKTAQIITLGTPHHGTAHAAFSAARDARQMRIGNPWLETLNAAPEVGVPTTSIYSLHDNVIAPQDSSHIGWGTNVILKGIGHLELSFSPAVQDAVYTAIRGTAHA